MVRRKALLACQRSIFTESEKSSSESLISEIENLFPLSKLRPWYQPEDFQSAKFFAVRGVRSKSAETDRIQRFFLFFDFMFLKMNKEWNNDKRATPQMT